MIDFNKIKHNSTYLNLSEYLEAFKIAQKSLINRFRKFESKQSYSFLNEKTYLAFLSTNEEFVRALKEN